MVFAPDPFAAKTAFQSLFDLEPVLDTIRVVPFNKVGDDADSFCDKGSRKQDIPPA